MTDSAHISRRAQLDILIREKESELKRLRKELTEYEPRESDWRCVAQIKDDMVHLETVRKSDGSKRRYAFRLLADKFLRRDIGITDCIKEVVEFRADTKRERGHMPYWVPLWDCPAITTLQIKRADGRTFFSEAVPLEDEWTKDAEVRSGG